MSNYEGRSSKRKKYCIECTNGNIKRRLEDTNYRYICQGCGKKLDKGDKFVYCPYCGTKVIGSKPSKGKTEKNKNKL